MKAREVKRKRLCDKFEAKRKEYKKSGDFESLQKLPKNSSPCRLRNRCIITGRPRGVYRKFKLSRIAFRELASDGKLPGVIKSSW